MAENFRPKTLAVLESRFNHNWRTDSCRSVLPYPTSIAYGFDSAERAAEIFNGAEGYGYARIGCKTPPVNELEKALVDLELGKAISLREEYGAVVYPSGMNAIFNIIVSLADGGRSIVSSPYLYGGTYHLFTEILPRLGIECFMIDDPLDVDSWRAGIILAKDPVCLYAEDNANPMIIKLDNRAIARLAHYHNLPYVCDMTITTPFLEQPMAITNSNERVDAVVHSLSKALNGYSNCLGGAVIARRDLLDNSENSLGLNEYFTYLGGAMDARVADVILHNLGDAKERVLEKAENALFVADYLKYHPKVERVFGPGCDLLSFQIEGGLEEARRLVESYKLIIFAPHLGDIQSLSIHPASTTHAKVPLEERRRMGITDNLIRLSVGLEDANDICDDLDQALEKI